MRKKNETCPRCGARLQALQYPDGYTAERRAGDDEEKRVSGSVIFACPACDHAEVMRWR